MEVTGHRLQMEIGSVARQLPMREVASGSVSGTMLTLKLKEASTARKITHLKEMSWSQERLLVEKKGVAALAFCEVPIATPIR